MIVTRLTIERAAESPFEQLRSPDGDLRGRLSFCHWGSSDKREDEGKDESDL